MKRKILILLLVPLLTACFLNEEVPEDQKVWTYALPGANGMDEGTLNQLDFDIKEELFGNIQGLTIIRNDQLVFENYYQGNDRSSLFPADRIGNAVVIALFGEVLNNKLANQLDTPVYRFFPEYENIFNESPLKKEITIEHLLTMKSGLSWNETIVNIDEQQNNVTAMLNSDDIPAYFFSRQIEAPPGLRFSYNSGSNLILLYLMDRLLDEPVESLFEERIFLNLNIEDYEVSRTSEGIPNYSYGLKLNQLDLTKLGYFFLKEGNWQGRQLIDSRWINASLSSQSEVSTQNNFGYHFWNFNDQSFIFQNYALDDIYYLYGNYSQGLYLSKSRDMVIAINNGLDPNRNFSNTSFWAMTRVLDSELVRSF